MKYKLGDKVRIKKDLYENKFYGEIRCNPSMSKFKGQIATIKCINAIDQCYRIDLDGAKYEWSDEMFEGLVKYTYEDLKKAPVGTKVTFENGEISVKTSKNTIESENWAKFLSDYKDLNFNLASKTIKIEEPNYTTIYEVKDILDEKEKEYLSNVIKPFRKKVKCIKKHDYPCETTSYLVIKFKEDTSLSFPDFKYGTMYKGMKRNREYSLEELGL